MPVGWSVILGAIPAGLPLVAQPGKLAYLDPGSGSYLLQLLIAGLLGAAFALRASWGRIKGLFGRMLGRGPKTDKGDREDDSGAAS